MAKINLGEWTLTQAASGDPVVFKNGETVHFEIHQDGTVNANGKLQEQGNPVATEDYVDDTVAAKDGSIDAETLEGNPASAFANAGHTHDSRYYNQGQDLTGTSRVGGSGLFFDFDNSSNWIELVDGSGSRSDLVTNDVYLDSGSGWLADYNFNDMVTGGYDIQVNGNDTSGVINFKTN